MDASSDPAISVMLSAEVFVATIARCRRVPLDVGEQRQLQIDLLRRRFDHEVDVGRAPPRCSVVVVSRAASRRRPRLTTLPELDALA